MWCRHRHGKGKRAGVYGAFLLACYDPDSEDYQVICKIGTGFTDEDLATHFKSLKEHVIDTPKNYYQLADNGEKPEVGEHVPIVWPAMRYRFH